MDSQTQVLIDAVMDASNLALSYYGKKNLQKWYKEQNSIVTEADRAVQALLVKRIKESFPNASMLGEEDKLLPKQESQNDEKLLFAIDPIDGTSSFSSKLPGWCVSVGVLKNKKPIAGVLFAPVWNELYVAPFNNEPATFNGQQLARIEKIKKIDSNTAMACDSKMLRVMNTTFPGKIRSFGSCALHIALVARGAVAFAQSNRVHLWDIAAAVAIGERVGIRFEYLSGNSIDYSKILSGERAEEPIFAGHKDDLPKIRQMFFIKK